MGGFAASFIAQFVGFWIAFGLALFVPAGTVHWLAAWVFLGLFAAFYLFVSLWLARHNPGLLRERTQLRAANQQGWDRWLFPAMLLGTFVWLAFLGLDGGRVHWSSEPPWLHSVGALTLLLSFVVLFLTFRENSYLSPVVRVQEERGHSVISTGPYHYVRHPMYSGILIFFVGTSLLLGSWYGVLIGLLPLVMLARRAVMEERMLRRALPGYDTYQREVRYRLIPYIW